MLTRDAAIGVLVEVLVAPITRTVRGIPTEVVLDETDGMSKPCVVSFDNLSTIAKSQLTEKITNLGEPRMQEVCRALNASVDC